MKLYVGNLPYSMTEEELQSTFAEHGEVMSANVIQDRYTGRSRGFGFVEMEDGSAKGAIEALNGQDLGGRSLVVNEARPRREGGGGGGGGGRGGFNRH